MSEHPPTHVRRNGREWELDTAGHDVQHTHTHKWYTETYAIKHWINQASKQAKQTKQAIQRKQTASAKRSRWARLVLFSIRNFQMRFDARYTNIVFACLSGWFACCSQLQSVFVLASSILFVSCVCSFNNVVWTLLTFSWWSRFPHLLHFELFVCVKSQRQRSQSHYHIFNRALDVASPLSPHLVAFHLLCALCTSSSRCGTLPSLAAYLSSYSSSSLNSSAATRRRVAGPALKQELGPRRVYRPLE